VTRLDVTHVITALPIGGAELVLLRLALATRARARVIALRGGPLAERLRAAGIDVEVVDLIDDVRGPARLARALRRHRSDIVQTWLYHGDLVGGVAARLLTTAPVVWNLRNTTLGPGTSTATRAVVHACAALSMVVPRRIVVSSDAAVSVHAALGYDRRKFVRIDNGVDLARFSPSMEDRRRRRAALRDGLGIAAGAKVFLCAARVHPQKDHATLLAAFSLLRARNDDVNLLLAGSGTLELLATVEPHLREGVTALGPRDDVAALLWCADVAVSSSASGESFPNAVLEALAAGVAVVATDVGDSARIVGPGGSIVRARDPRALADAMAAMAMQDVDRLHAIGRAGHAHVAARWTLPAMAACYDELYEQIVDEVRAERHNGARHVRHRRNR
jgi:glycosyltransferase involved in cell wall biosynthesis